MIVLIDDKKNLCEIHMLSSSFLVFSFSWTYLLLNSYLSSLYVSAAPTTGGLMPAISLTDNALKHLNKMRSDRTEDLCLRIGVKQGGCSGMSYTMEFEDRAKTRPDDSIIEYNGFVIGRPIFFFSPFHEENDIFENSLAMFSKIVLKFFFWKQFLKIVLNVFGNKNLFGSSKMKNIYFF